MLKSSREYKQVSSQGGACSMHHTSTHAVGLMHVVDVVAGVFSFDGREWEVVTEAAKDMITQMLVMDITKRATAKQLLQHRWFQVRAGMELRRCAWTDYLYSDCFCPCIMTDITINAQCFMCIQGRRQDVLAHNCPCRLD